jgi:hypothetical protein
MSGSGMNLGIENWRLELLFSVQLQSTGRNYKLQAVSCKFE